MKEGEATLAIRSDALTDRWVVELVPISPVSALSPNEGRVPVAWKVSEDEARAWASCFWRVWP